MRRDESGKGWLRWGGKFPVPPAPMKLQAAGVQGVLRQDQPRTLLAGQTSFNQGEIQVRIATVEFVPHNGMPKMRQMDANLVFAASPRLYSQ